MLGSNVLVRCLTIVSAIATISASRSPSPLPNCAARTSSSARSVNSAIPVPRGSIMTARSRRLRVSRPMPSSAIAAPITRTVLTATGHPNYVQESDWNCGNLVTPNHKSRPFDDVRVRHALTLAIDRWHGAPALSRISIMKTVGGVGFPGSILAAPKARWCSPQARRNRASWLQGW